MPTYRMEYVAPARGSVAHPYETIEPLQARQWISVGSVYLVVERVIRGKPGDAFAGIALCRLAQG